MRCRRAHEVLTIGALVVGALSVAGCSSGPSERVEAATVRAVGLRLDRTDLTGPERARTQTWAAGYARQLAAAHPELARLRVAGVFATFDEVTPVPTGALVRFALPERVPRLQLDLIRSRGEVPERVPSEVTNLRGLDVIYEFSGGEVIFIGVAPQDDDASTPDEIAVARPLVPGRQADPAFSDDE